MKDMYSAEWFDTFAATVPPSIIETELDGIGGVLPLGQYPRISMSDAASAGSRVRSARAATR